jgi:iron uptake system component EfeO
MRLNSLAALLLFGGLIFAAGCSSDSDSDSSGNTTQLQVEITPDGCSPAVIDTKAGPTTFVVTNKGAAAVDEFEVLDGDRVLGEAENVAPGLTGKFTLNLKAGTYTTYCPGGKTTEKGVLNVTGDGAAAPSDPDLDAALQKYDDYVTDQVGQLVAAVKDMRDAIGAGSVDQARAKYIAARPYYERIEPVAESFGDLDPAIDARADDAGPEALTGFHRIEYGLWEKNSTDGLKEVADQLVKDVETLQSRIPDFEYDALAIANGAVDLLGEVTSSKITGEEERYSHIDLIDFQANVDGAREAFTALQAALAKRQPDLAKTLETEFANVYAALSGYKTASGYVLYTDLKESDTRLLAQKIDALGEPLSEMAEAISQPPKAN